MKKHIRLLTLFGLLLLLNPGLVQGGPAVIPGPHLTPQPTWALDLRYGYTGASTSDSLGIFDLTTWTLSTTLSLLPEGDYPYDATIKPDGSEVWICGAAGDGVVVVDTATNQVTHRIAVGVYAIGVAFRTDGAYAFVSARDGENVSVIDTTTYAVIDTIPIPTYYLGAGNMAINPCSDEMYVVDWYDDSLIVVDTTAMTVTRVVRNVGTNLWQVVVHPRGDFVYVTDRGPDVVVVLDPVTLGIITTIPVGSDPWGIDITPDGALIYVANEDSHDVTAIDATDNSVITTIALPHGSGSDPRDVDFDILGAYAYVPSGEVTGDDEVYVLDTGTHTVAGRIAVAPAANSNVVAVAPQMAGCGGLWAGKEAQPEPVVLGDALTYTVSYLYTEVTPTAALVTDTLPAGTIYVTSSGGLGSVYHPVEHQVTWDLGPVPSGGNGTLTVVVVPSDGSLPGQSIANQADLKFGDITTTAWATSTVVTPVLAIRFPDGGVPPDPLEICAAEVVALAAFSNRGGPLSYTWDLGDGSLANTREITHSWGYGDYTVTVTATNAYGWAEQDTLALRVGRAPEAGFLSNSPVDLGWPAVFTDTSTFSPTVWAWDFGDGAGQSDAQNPVYTYTSGGLYTVTLTAGNACGADGFSGTFEVIEQCEPLQTAAISGPLMLEAGLVGLYSGSFAPPTATQPVTITWDNGTIGNSAAYSWTLPGSYTIAATATNPCGAAVATFSVTVLAGCQPLQTAAVNGPLVLEVGEVGLYNASFTPPTATQPVTITWDNGTVGSSAAYSWTLAGTYTIAISVTNPCGAASGTLLIEVLPSPAYYRIYLPLVVR